MPARFLAEPTLLMTMTDIAELAGVQRPVVTTWRRRHADFPAPAGGDESQPLFGPSDVAAWLFGTGRIGRERADQELSLFMLTGARGPLRRPGRDRRRDRAAMRALPRRGELPALPTVPVIRSPRLAR
jgi:hypothetical protein